MNIDFGGLKKYFFSKSQFFHHKVALISWKKNYFHHSHNFMPCEKLRSTIWANYFLQFKIIFNFAQNIYIFEKCKISQIGNFHLLITPLLPMSLIYVKCLIASSHWALHIHVLIGVNSTRIDHAAAIQKCVFSRLLQYHTHFSYKFFFLFFFGFSFFIFLLLFFATWLICASGTQHMDRKNWNNFGYGHT